MSLFIPWGTVTTGETWSLTCVPFRTYEHMGQSHGGPAVSSIAVERCYSGDYLCRITSSTHQPKLLPGRGFPSNIEQDLCCYATMDFASFNLLNSNISTSNEGSAVLIGINMLKGQRMTSSMCFCSLIVLSLFGQVFDQAASFNHRVAWEWSRAFICCLEWCCVLKNSWTDLFEKLHS